MKRMKRWFGIAMVMIALGLVVAACKSTQQTTPANPENTPTETPGGGPAPTNNPPAGGGGAEKCTACASTRDTCVNNCATDDACKEQCATTYTDCAAKNCK